MFLQGNKLQVRAAQIVNSNIFRHKDEIRSCAGSEEKHNLGRKLLQFREDTLRKASGGRSALQGPGSSGAMGSGIGLHFAGRQAPSDTHVFQKIRGLRGLPLLKCVCQRCKFWAHVLMDRMEFVLTDVIVLPISAAAG